EPAEESLLQELQRLQFTPVNARDLTAARQEAVAYLESKPVREWFASHDILVRREEGIEWIQSMSPEDMRVAARDLLIMNRVVASCCLRGSQKRSLCGDRLDTAPPSRPVGAAFSRRAPAEAAADTTFSGSAFPG